MAQRTKSQLENWVQTNWSTIERLVPLVNRLPIGVNGDNSAHMCLKYKVGGILWIFDPNGFNGIFPIAAYDKNSNRKVLEECMSGSPNVKDLGGYCDEDPHSMVQKLCTLKGGVCYLICVAVHAYIKQALKRGMNIVDIRVGIKQGFMTKDATREFLLRGMPDRLRSRLMDFI